MTNKDNDQDRNNRPPEEMHRERDLTQYEEELHGLENVFAYLLSLSGKPLLVDLGTGSGRALRQISEQHSEIQVRGIDTVAHPNARLNLGDNLLIRDASHVPELADSSVHGMLAVNSIAYADDEKIKLIAKEVSRALAEGGVIKGTALSPLVVAESGMKQTSLGMESVLREEGLVVVTLSELGLIDAGTERSDVFLAAKPAPDEDLEEWTEKLTDLLLEDHYAQKE